MHMKNKHLEIKDLVKKELDSMEGHMDEETHIL